MGGSEKNMQAPGSAIKVPEDDVNSNPRKPKPGLAIYRPGSGPLRRTNPIVDRSNEAADRLTSSDRDTITSAAPTKHRNRKPQQAYYVPKPVADRLKKYQDDKGRSLSQIDLPKAQCSEGYRAVRQGSEPRVIPSRHPLDRIPFVHPKDRRMRDSRSVEPVAVPSSKDLSVRENRPNSCGIEKCSLSTARPEDHTSSTSIQAVDEWDGSTLTFIGKHQVNEQVDPEPSHSASDPSVGKSRQTEEPEHQALVSAPERVAITDGNHKDGKIVSQPSPPSGGKGLSHRRNPVVNGGGRSRGRLQPDDLSMDESLPGGLKSHSGPGSFLSEKKDIRTDVSPVVISDKNNKTSTSPAKPCTVDQDTTAPSPPCHKLGKADERSDLSKPLDWSEEVEEALSKVADQEKQKSVSLEKLTSGSTSSNDGLRRKCRNRQVREKSKDGAHAYRSCSSSSSSKFGQHSSEETWDDPDENCKPATVLNSMQTGFSLMNSVSDSGGGDSSNLKKCNIESNVDRSNATSKEQIKPSVRSINPKHKDDNRDLQNRLTSRACEARRGSCTESREKLNVSGSNERYRASSGDRYTSRKLRAGSTERFSRGGGNDGYRRANSKDRSSHFYSKDCLQRAGSRNSFTRFGDKDQYSRADTTERWPHDLFKASLSESKRMPNDRGRSYSKDRYNRTGTQEKRLYDPSHDRLSRGRNTDVRHKPYLGNSTARRAPILERTSGAIKYPSTPSLDSSHSKQRTDGREYPQKSDVPVSKPEQACEGPKADESGKDCSFELPRRENVEVKQETTESLSESLVTVSLSEEANNAKSVVPGSSESSMSRSGIIILTTNLEEKINDTTGGSVENLIKPVLQEVSSNPPVHKQLFDPNNPNKPISVVTSGIRACRSESGQDIPPAYPAPDIAPTDYSVEMASCWNLRDNRIPAWLDPSFTRSHALNAPQRLTIDTDSVVRELLWYIHNGSLIRDWKHILKLRAVLENLLSKFLKTDIKFCARENVEKYLWTISTHRLIEKLRELMGIDPNRKEEYKAKMLTLIESDTEHLEKLVRELEDVYHFQIETFLRPPVSSDKRDGYVGLALLSVQKIYLFLGDLARYKEEVNQSTNYGKCRQWYLKAHLINPRNGLPYNQLAVIAVLARRKLDAVYYYMRSIMASNTVLTAREKIVILFDEARRKYEMLEKKRNEENPPKDDLKEKESRMGLQREFWIHPQAGVPRLHITTSAVPELLRDMYRQEDELRKLDSVELNKRFIISYINVQGKLYTKVGMESFQEAALCMLLEFRALIQHKPLPLNVLRFLQLLALNMFSLHTTKLRQVHDERYRAAFQEKALIVALQMFSLLLERCNSLLRDQLDSLELPRYLVPEDMITLLPAIKVWCDWLLCHVKTWNPPPSCSDYTIGPPEDVWERFATFINLLEQLYIPGGLLMETPVEGCDVVRLPEDSTLCYFLPLIGKTDEETYYAKDDDMEVAYVALRIRKILFFGTVFLCGIEPPVLKLHHSAQDTSKYVSVVQSRLKDLQSASDIRLESFSEDECEIEVNPEEAERRANIVREALRHEGGETLTLLRRREELERDLERHKIIVQEVLRNSQIYIEIDVKPRTLIPDTNTFIDHLPALRKILEISNGSEYFYSFAVPLVVFRELEGLSLGGRFCDSIKQDTMEHMEIVAEAAKDALLFLRSKHPRVRSFTTRGTMIPISSCVMNEDNDEFTCNDDRILATAVSLISVSGGQSLHEGKLEESAHPRRVVREVVLLTEDRCLRMKAMTKLVPTRDIPDFVKWAGLS